MFQAGKHVDSCVLSRLTSSESGESTLGGNGFQLSSTAFKLQFLVVHICIARGFFKVRKMHMGTLLRNQRRWTRFTLNGGRVARRSHRAGERHVASQLLHSRTRGTAAWALSGLYSLVSGRKGPSSDSFPELDTPLRRASQHQQTNPPRVCRYVQPRHTRSGDCRADSRPYRIES